MTKQHSPKLPKGKVIELITWLVIGLVSFFIVSKYVSAPDYNAAVIESLTTKEKTVMALVSSSAATSTMISMLPDDIGSPIANQIAALTPQFIVILGAIVLQKVLLGVVGYLSFSIIIPFSCFLGFVSVFVKEKILKDTAIKLLVLGIIVFAIIPAGVKVSDMLYATSQETINEARATLEKNEKYIEEQKKEMDEADKNWFDKIGTYLANTTSKIGNSISQILKKAEFTLMALIEIVAVLIISTCIIPIVVVLVFCWIVNLLFHIDIGKKVMNSSLVKNFNRLNQYDEDIE